jgi:hypothetical protein
LERFSWAGTKPFLDTGVGKDLGTRELAGLII